nr:hypothetical protein [Tanacetum cinerariifolium]
MAIYTINDCLFPVEGRDEVSKCWSFIHYGQDCECCKGSRCGFKCFLHGCEDLSDFVTGFHKRKKKRRKEAQNQQQEALRRKRIELRKKRKEDRDYVLYGGAPPGPDAEPNENDEVEEAEDDDEQKTSVSGTKVYANGSVKVMVTTSEISREDDTTNVNQRVDEVPKSNSGPEKKQNLPVIKKKPFKKVEKRRSRPKTLTKRDKRMVLCRLHLFIHATQDVDSFAIALMLD